MKIRITVKYPNGETKTFETTQSHLKTQEEAQAEFERVFRHSIESLGWEIVSTEIKPKD